MLNIYFAHKACNGVMEILEKATVHIKSASLAILGYEKGTEEVVHCPEGFAVNFGRALFLFKERHMY